MSNVVGTFTTTKQDFPLGTVDGGYVLTLTETTTGAVLTGHGAVGDLTVTIPNVIPGTYNGTISSVDTSGNVLGTAVASAAPVTVTAPSTVTINVPASLTLSVS